MSARDDFDSGEDFDGAGVLEHNLQRLFAVSYAPVVCTPEFRERLARALVAEMRTRTRISPVSARGPRRLQWAAAASIILAIGAWIATLLHSHLASSTVHDIMARGSVGVRIDSESDWREIEARDARRGFDCNAQALAVATPKDLEFEVRFGSAGRARLDGASRAEFDASEAAFAIRLEEGALGVERFDNGAPWTIGACGARVELVRGSLRASIGDAEARGAKGPALVVVLERGEASALLGGVRSALHIGVEVVLQGDRALAATVGLDAPRTAAANVGSSNSRTSAISVDPGSVGPGSVDPANATTTAPAAPTTARLVGKLALADNEAPPQRYAVTLMRRERLPAVSTPKTTTFDGVERFVYENLTAGSYEIFVEAEGVGVWHKSDVALVAGATCALDVELANGVTLRGRVVAASTGAPIAGASVIAEDDVPAQIIPFTVDGTPWRAACTTRSDGTFELAHLGSGAHTLRATKAGFGAGWSAGVAEADANSTNEIVLRLESAGTLQGRVARDDGTPWNGAVVVASYLGRGRTLARFSYGIGVAGADGRYTIPDLPAGDFVLLNALDARSARDASAAKQVRVEAGTVTIANLPETSDGSRLHGRVLDARGQALAGLDVTLQPSGIHDATGWRSQRTDDAGRYVFSSVPGGTYDVFVGEGLGERFVQQERFEIPRAGDIEHDIRLDAGAIRGRALRAHSTTPVGSAFLLLEVRDRDEFTFAGRSVTDAEGNFAFERLHPGTYRVTVYPTERGLAPSAGAEVWITPTALEARSELSVEFGATLQIRVVDAGGVPRAGARVHFVDDTGRARQFTASDVTGQDGTLAVPGIGVGRWSVSATFGESHTQNADLQLEVGDARDVVLRLVP